MAYNPTQSPSDMTSDDLRKFVDDELRNLQASFADNDLTVTNLNAALAALIPSGTRMVFQQTAAPTGWTKDVVHNDKLFRLVNGTVTTGGTTAFTTVNAQTTVGNHTLTAAEQASMSVSVSGTVTVYPAGSTGWNFPITAGTWSQAAPNAPGGGSVTVPVVSNNSMTYTNQCSAANSMTGTASGSGGAHNHPITLGIQYVDFIICTKN